MNLPKDFLQNAKEWDAKNNAFAELVSQNPAVQTGPCGQGEEAASLINGFPFAANDNIAVKGMSFACGSKHLAKVLAPYSAAAVQKLEAAGGIVIGKTNIDEFGMDGSINGAAAVVAAGIAPYALGADAGGSLRQAAAFYGVAGLKPTYGAVSRYGLAAYASSLETIGVFADTIDRCRAVFSIIRGKDPFDQSSCDAPETAPPLYPQGAGDRGAKRIGVLSPQAITEAVCASHEMFRGFELAKERLAALGHTLVEIKVPGLEYAAPAYYAIATAEASSNLARFDSIRYGARPDFAENPDGLYDKSREAGFGPEAKLQILLGTLMLRSGFQDKYYFRANRIRLGLKARFEALLGGSDSGLDAILMPVFPMRASGKTLSHIAQKAASLCCCCANLAGLPALSFPAAQTPQKQPLGVQLLGRAFSESTLLDIAKGYEQQHPFKN
jgi:aspartyl-tRNA(Asn)/glutamyl-tRNA(Gln) amidotransferase subunit A